MAGIDSGSTSTDVVILDKDGKIKSTMIIPTGGGAMMSAEKSLEMAVEKAGIRKEDIVRIVTTGYGRAYIYLSRKGSPLSESECAYSYRHRRSGYQGNQH